MTLMKINISQDYIQFNNQYYKKNNRLAMEVSTPAILAELFIQHPDIPGSFIY
jgi:hypothetical protein